VCSVDEANASQLWESLSVDRTTSGPTASSKHGGHSGIASDIRLVWSNCIGYMSRQSAEHPLVESATALSGLFETLYENKITGPIGMKASMAKSLSAVTASVAVKAGDGTDTTNSDDLKKSGGYDERCDSVDEDEVILEAPIEDWNHVIKYLSEHEFSNASVEIKLLMLTWACNELLQTNKCKNFFDSIIESYLQRVAITTKTPSKSKDGETVEKDDGAEDVDEPPKKKKGPATSATKAKAATDEAVLSNAPQAAPSTSDSVTAESLLEGETFEETIRLVSLGRDRDCRTYWSFGGPKHRTGLDTDVPARIFCEDPETTEWCVFNDERDLCQLTSWLSDKGHRELALRKAIIEWGEANRVTVVRKPVVDEPVQLAGAAKSGPKANVSSRRRKSQPGDEPASSGDTLAAIHDGDAGDDGKNEDDITSTSGEASNPATSGNHQSSSTTAVYHINPYQYIKDFTAYWVPNEKNPLSFNAFVYLNEEFQLGLGLKCITGHVVVTSMKPDQRGRSAGRDAGIRVGDIVIGVENKYVAEIEDIKNAIKNLSAAPKAVPAPPTNQPASPRDSVDPLRKSVRVPASSSTSQEAPESSAEQAPARPCLRLLILRYPDLSSYPSLKEAIETDANVKTALKAQADEEAQRLQGNYYQYSSLPQSIEQECKQTEIRSDPFMHPFKEVHSYSSREVGSVISLLSRSMHPFCVSDEFLSKSIPDAVVRISQLLGRIDERSFTRVSLINAASATPIVRRMTKTFQKLETQIGEVEAELLELSDSLLALLIECTLDFEEALTVGGNMLTKHWTEHRRRFKWQRVCREANTCSKLSMCLGALSSVIDWSRLSMACSSLTLQSWFKQPRQIQTVIPAENSLVVYMGDAHRHEEDSDAKSGRPKMWGATPDLPLVNGGVVCSCIVTSLRILLSGPPERFFPFVQVDLTVVNSKLNQTAPVFSKDPRATGSSTISSRNSQAHLGHVYRVVNRLVNFIRVLPEAKAFLEPVNIHEHPDYHQVIADPIDLGAIRLKAREGGYSRIDGFVEDVTKLRDNCVKYCEVRYPQLVVCANRLLEETRAVVDLIHVSSGAGGNTGATTDNSGEDSVVGSPEPMEVSTGGSHSAGGGSITAPSAGSATGNQGLALNLAKKGTTLKGIPLLPV
jgi:hypothetical protein